VRWRPWLAAAGIALAVVAAVPPFGVLATRYVFAQALQFAVLAVVAPALVVLGAPWRLGGARVAERAASRRMGRPAGMRLWAVPGGYLVVAMGWRLPVAVNALVRHPVLTVAEAISLVVAGVALWLELVESPPFAPRAARPARAVLAALPMWTIWASAYIMGFSRSAWFTALAHLPGHGLGTVADQQIAAAILWAVPALSFIPVVYFSWITWLRDSAARKDDPRDGARAAASGGLPAPRPPRGWRLPPA
jgi:cytochrome c oxidase assembly factor CtaG